jgi:hypothetical protein
MAIDSYSDRLKPEAVAPLKARGAVSPIESLVRLLARQAACETLASGLDKAPSEVSPAAVAPSAEK